MGDYDGIGLHDRTAHSHTFMGMRPVGAKTLSHISNSSSESARDLEYHDGSMWGLCRTVDVEDLENEETSGKACDEMLTSKIPLQDTSYDAVVMALVCLEDEGYRNRHGQAALLQFLTGLSLHIMVVIVQVSIVVFLLVTTTQTAAQPYRDDIEGKTKIILDAVASHTYLAIDGPGMTLCQEMDTLQGAHFLIQFIWSARMLQEFVDVMWRLVHVYGMAQGQVDQGGIVEDDDGHILIAHNNACVTWMCMLISPIPQVLCAVFLWWTGAKFLFFAHTMGVLIMKAISIAFITSLDEMMYKSFAPKGFKEVVHKTRYLYCRGRPHYHWHMWGVSIAKVAFALTLSCFVYWGVYGNVTAFRGACWKYWGEFPSDIPHRGNETMFTSLLKGLELA